MPHVAVHKPYVERSVIAKPKHGRVVATLAQIRGAPRRDGRLLELQTNEALLWAADEGILDDASEQEQHIVDAFL